MIFLRSAIFHFLFFLITFPMVLVGTVTLLFPLKVMNTYKQVWLWIIFKMTHLVVGLRHRVVGWEHMPKGPYIIACKHQSTFETFILPYEFPHLLICLKKQLVDFPLSGWYFKKYGMVSIDRDKPKRALLQIIQAAQKTDLSKSPLLLFPEGTRTKPGDSPAYKGGIGVLYDTLKVPVLPIATNTGVFWPRRGFLRKPGVAILKILPPIPVGLSKEEFMKTLEHVIETESKILYGDTQCLKK